ncbi:PAS domain S-box protein [Rufibacter sp. LB8]|uniref:PAS domain S-box protein n=1 Tax=Rufibacter sp. LB8 TaxID=2777781 RepID=UPI00178C6B88|nr:PAS domain S-box protein [Rufibacter sp. LB8]
MEDKNFLGQPTDTLQAAKPEQEGSAASAFSPADHAAAGEWAWVPKEEMESLQLELHIARQELMIAKAQAMRIATEKVSTGTLRDMSEYRRLLELERLGKEVLEMNALPGSTLEKTVEFYLAGVERLHGGMMCSCMRLKDGKLYKVAAPSLPQGFSKALEGSSIGDNVGSCGTAAYLGCKVIAADIAHDPRWVDFSGLALSFGLKASWSFPILGGNRKVLGTLAVFYNNVKSPTPEEEASLDSIRNLLQVIMENKLAVAELQASNERFRLAAAATNDAIYDWDIVTNHLVWGAGFEKVFGYAVTYETETLAFWESLLVPADKERVTTSLYRAMAEQQTKNWLIEYSAIKADGSVAIVEERGFVIRDSAGKAIRMVGAIQNVTARKEAEEELRKLSVIAQETLNGVIIMKSDLSIQWVNEAFVHMMGYALEEAVGHTPGQLMNGEDTDPDTIGYIDQQLARCAPLQCELVQYSKTGQKFWVRLQVQTLQGSQGETERLFAFLTDITRQKEEEERLRLLESVVTNAQEAITISQVDARDSQKLQTMFLNQAFTHMTGYGILDMLGQDPMVLAGPETEPAAVATLQSLIQEKVAGQVELVNYRKNGEKFWSHLSLIPIFNKEEMLTHWISMQHDITARKQYETERELLIAELTHNNADLKQFSFITSHNLRAPLSNLTGIVNLIDLAALPEGRNKLLIEKFKEAILQLNTTIDDLLEVLVIKNSVQIKKEPLALEQAFTNVTATLHEQLQEMEAQISTDFSEAPVVEYNAGYLHSILLNLLSNAMKYRSPARGLQVSVVSRAVPQGVEVTFKDNGLGIDLTRYGDRIFGLYQRFHQHKDSKGLGLYIARSQANAMGGDLKVASQVDQGTTFTLTINQ